MWLLIWSQLPSLDPDSQTHSVRLIFESSDSSREVVMPTLDLIIRAEGKAILKEQTKADPEQLKTILKSLFKCTDHKTTKLEDNKHQIVCKIKEGTNPVIDNMTQLAAQTLTVVPEEK